MSDTCQAELKYLQDGGCGEKADSLYSQKMSHNISKHYIVDIFVKKK